MKILFLGGNFSKEMETEILRKSKGVVHYAANKLQWNIIDGLATIPEVELEILSAPFVGTFPKEYKNLFIKKSSVFYNGSIKSLYIPFCNLWGYRNISRKKNLKKQIKNFIEEKSLKKVIVVYSPHTPFLQAAVFAKTKDPRIHICLVVPDLPQYMNLSENITPIYSILKELDIKIFNKNSRYVNSFVLLTEHMKGVMNVADRPYTVIEGMVRVPNKEDTELNIQNIDLKTIVYTGTLHKKFGVINLVKAFTKIKNPNIVLKICGKGDSESLINEYADKDKRIHFLGQISNDESQKIQENAAILVNPRQDNEEYTKYSFPSKNMEYLLSGVPVVAYKLRGIPDEYDNYINYVGDNTIESLKAKIEELLNKDEEERDLMGIRAREFVINQKNNIQQSKKMLDMIKNNLE